MELTGKDIKELLEMIEDPGGWGDSAYIIPIVRDDYTDVTLTGHTDLEEFARILNKLAE